MMQFAKDFSPMLYGIRDYQEKKSIWMKTSSIRTIRVKDIFAQNRALSQCVSGPVFIKHRRFKGALQVKANFGP
jgi:hypothetical protein